VRWGWVRRVRGATRAFGQDEDGAGLVEYALILALIAIGVIVALAFLAGGIGSAFEMISDNVEAVITNEDPVEVGRRHGRGWCRRFGC
jgi:pilus assembly protein Flp/PilA